VRIGYESVFMISLTNQMDRVADCVNAVVGNEEERGRQTADAARTRAKRD
jgi:hypothetical protein